MQPRDAALHAQAVPGADGADRRWLGVPELHADPCRRSPATHEEVMRLEQQFEGAIAEWCCPMCHRRTPLIVEQPIDSILEQRDAQVILVSRQAADALRVASEPVRIQVEPTSDPRVLDLIAKRDLPVQPKNEA